MPWVETQSLSFAARHETADADEAAELLALLERMRIRLGERFDSTPGEVAVVLHPRPFMLALAQPLLPLARLASAPAGRRYMAGWSSPGEIHVLAPAALEARASSAPGSLDAIRLAPQREYARLVAAANNPSLPPPFARRIAAYRRWAWLSEGAAAHHSGQVRHLGRAILRRLREGPAPSLPPSPRDAFLLGGTVLAHLERERGPAQCRAIVTAPGPDPKEAIEDAFDRPLHEVEGSWRGFLGELAGG